MPAPAPSFYPRALSLLACALFLPSCGPSTSPLTVELRTADTHAAIPGAGVEIDSLALGPSLQVSDVVDDLMGRRVSFTDRALTDAAGRATIAHIPDRSLCLTILAPGNPPLFSLYEHPVPAAPGPWRHAGGNTTGPSPIEYRLSSECASRD